MLLLLLSPPLLRKLHAYGTRALRGFSTTLPPVTMWRLWEGHMPNLVEIHQKLWPVSGNKEMD